MIQREITDREQARAEYARQRGRYLSREITHAEFYTWLAEYIGVTAVGLPVPLERIEASTDEHLNDIALVAWDRCDWYARGAAYRRGLAWSLSDTVCVMKQVARIAVAARRHDA